MAAPYYQQPQPIYQTEQVVLVSGPQPPPSYAQHQLPAIEKKECSSCHHKSSCCDTSDDNPIYILDPKEHYSDPDANTIMRKFVRFSNVVYRAGYKFFYLFTLFWCLWLIPFIGMFVGMFEVMINVFYRPFARPVGRLFSEALGYSNSLYFHPRRRDELPKMV